MRNAFADALTELSRNDPRVVMLSGDIGNRLFDRFRAENPDRFYNCGVAEQNMMGLAAGMAMSGHRPVVYTIAPFVTTRCLEQIRTDVCYHNLPVTIVSVGAGLSYAGLGPSHHACEDIALLRVLPNMKVVCPGDAFEVRAALAAALAQDGPLYLRMGKKGEPVIHDTIPKDFRIGSALTIKTGAQICILSNGTMLPEALEAAKQLDEAGLSTEVLSFHTVKPLDEPTLMRVFRAFQLVVTVEEHSLIGGFGSAVAEWLVDNGMSVTNFLRIGAPDAFFKQSGEQDFAREQLNLTGRQIADRLKRRMTHAH